MLRKLSIVILILIMTLTPVLLTGCIPNGTTGDTGGVYVPPDDPDDPDIPDDGNNGTIIDLSDYFDGVKITYNPDLSGDLSGSTDNNNNGVGDKQDYVNDVKSQINTMSKETIIRLMAEYGNGIGLGGYRLYYYVNGEQQFEDIYEDGFEPFDADPATYGTTYTYAHKDAVRKDFYNNSPSSYYTWNWTIANVGYNSADYIDAYLTSHSDNMQIAIYMIKLNKNIQEVGSADYNEYIGYTALSLQDKELLKDELAREVAYLGMLEEEIERLGQFILNVVIGEDILTSDSQRFIDVDANGTFDAEQFVDSNMNGLYDEGEVFNDLNRNGVWDSGVSGGAYDFMDSYFKNYVNTVKSITTVISENIVRYPLIAALQFQDYVFSDVESSLDEIFTIPTGNQVYKSLIFMPSQAINLESIWLAFESTRSFNLQITARYHKVSEGVIFDNLLTTLTVNSGAYDIFDNANDFEINVASILESYNVTDSSLNAFTNNTESYDTAIVLNTMTAASNYFTLEKTEDGTSTLAKYNDTSTDFFEIVFYASPLDGDTNTNPILFRFGFIDISLTSAQ